MWRVPALCLGLVLGCGPSDPILEYPGGDPVDLPDDAKSVRFDDSTAPTDAPPETDGADVPPPDGWGEIPPGGGDISDGDSDSPPDGRDTAGDSDSQGADVQGPGLEPAATVLSVDGRWFKDPAGRVVLLRGVNVAGNSKVPPFVPFSDMSKLDALHDWGMNVVRLVFTWEAYEPLSEEYDEAYLDALATIAEAAWARGLYVIVDFHQDGYSRHLAQGCGDGFPKWALPPEVSADAPDNSDACHDWATKVALDNDVHTAFGAFYADTYGVRTRYLDLMARLAKRFGPIEGVIGYDLFNEPWGWEDSELAPLYEDAAVAIRAHHPDAILFVEGHITTNTGIDQTELPKPTFGNFAYAPHFYESLALVSGIWSGLPTATDVAYFTMTSKADDWNVPLFIGEFGIGATAINGLGYVDLQYERMNDHLASGAYWNYTPGWSAAHKDGWNGEDLSLVDDVGNTRPTFRNRAYARRITGTPTALEVSPTSITLEWQHVPALGQTEIYVPFAGAIQATGEGLGCWFEQDTVVLCQSDDAGKKQVTITKGGQ